MQGLDQILGSSGMDVGSLGARFGLSPEQTRSAMGSLMPAVLGGFQKRSEADDLGQATSAASGIDTPDTATGNAVLGNIFGGKDVSRQVADHAAGQSGVSSTVLKAMLPIVAAMVAKHVASSGGASAAGGAGGGLGGILGSLLGGGAATGGAAGGLGGLGGLGHMLGGGGAGGGAAGRNPLDAILSGLR